MVTVTPRDAPPPPPPPHTHTHTEGVTLVLIKEAQRTVINWEAVRSRIIAYKFRTNMKNIRIEVVLCYTPTSGTEEEKKEDFN